MLKLKILVLFAYVVFTFSACKTEEIIITEPGVYEISSDTSENLITMELLNPNQILKFKAYKYKESDVGYRDLFLNEFYLSDSGDNKKYRLRILTHKLALDTGIYQTTDNNYNPFHDKVYMEFFRLEDNKEMLYVSTIHQKENYFNYYTFNSDYRFLSFRILAKFSNPDRYAVINGKFKIKK